MISNSKNIMENKTKEKEQNGDRSTVYITVSIKINPTVFMSETINY